MMKRERGNKMKGEAPFRRTGRWKAIEGFSEENWDQRTG